MGRKKRRLTALLLALALLLGLAACGKGREDEGQLSGTVYVPEFLDLDLGLDGGSSDLRGACTDGVNVYILVAIYPEEGDWRNAIYRVPLDGGKPSELENFRPGEAPEGYDEATVYINSIRAGADGSLWVTENVYAYSYDLPEDFDPETDYPWNYELKDSLDTEYRVQLDSTGAEITRAETGNLAEKLEVDYFWGDDMLVDGDGDSYAVCEGKIVVLDPHMNVRFSVEDGDLWGGALVRLSDGTVGAVTGSYDRLAETTVRRLRTIDKAGKKWGESYDLPAQSYEVYDGGGDYLFYYKVGDVLYGWRADVPEGAEHGERLLSWLEADIDSDAVQFFSFLADGRVVVMTRAWYGDGGPEVELSLLTATERSQLPEKATLTYACMYLGQDERNMILKFNRSSATHRIQVTDYSEYAADGDYTAAMTKLNTEILSGKVPDIISLNQLPVGLYGRKGILADLWPFIDADPELGRDKLMLRPLEAAELDGRLYRVFSGFTIQTIIGATGVVGEDMGWTMAEFQAALDSMPAGCEVFSPGYTKEDMLNTLLTQNLESFVDWEEGKCFFDGEDFQTALAFCNKFPATFNSENFDWSAEENQESVRIAEGRQLLSQAYLYNFETIQTDEVIFGGEAAVKRLYITRNYGVNGVTAELTDGPVKTEWGGINESCRLRPGRYITYKGYPREDGSCGSSFTVDGGLAISARCQDKEAAWSLVRQLLLPGRDQYYSWGFPINREDFEKMAEESMKAEYYVDAEGNTLLDAEGEPVQYTHSGYGIGRDFMLDIVAVSQEEYDQFMELYNAITTIAGYDEKIFTIVKEVAGSYFAGDRTVESAAALIQNRVKLYVGENT